MVFFSEDGHKSWDLHCSNRNQVGSFVECFAGKRAPRDWLWDLLGSMSMEIKQGFRNHVRFVELSKESKLASVWHFWESNKASMGHLIWHSWLAMYKMLTAGMQLIQWGLPTKTSTTRDSGPLCMYYMQDTAYLLMVKVCAHLGSTLGVGYY